MKLYVGITDYDWFRYLQAMQPEELNFWQPGGMKLFKTLLPGEPFLFKLHSPRNFIVGGGFFAHASLLPTSLAWEAFGEKNGATSLAEMRRRIEKYRRVPPQPQQDYQIGCILLEQPFFLNQEDWISVPEDFARNIVQGRSYDMGSGTGKSLWEAVRTVLPAEVPPQVGEQAPTRGDPVSSARASARARSVSSSPTCMSGAAPSRRRGCCRCWRRPTSCPSARAASTRPPTGSSCAPISIACSTGATRR